MGEESVGHLVVKFEFWAYIKEWVSFNSVLNLKEPYVRKASNLAKVKDSPN